MGGGCTAECGGRTVGAVSGAANSAVTPRSSACWEVAIVYARLGRSCFEHQRAVLVGWPAVLAAAEDALPLNSLSPRKDSAP